MKDSPLIVGLLAGLIVILVIAGVSFLVKMNFYSEAYKKELSKGMSFQKNLETLTRENAVLKEKNTELKSEMEGLKVKADDLKLEIMKLEKLKEKLEENLKNELIKEELEKQPQEDQAALPETTESSKEDEQPAESKQKK